MRGGGGGVRPFGFTNLAWPMMPTNEGPTERKEASLPGITDQMIQILHGRHQVPNDNGDIGCQQNAYRNPLR